jgi:NAD(P)-dependent dehydrogenase (short-subunit alcohol dehydrogenase family)
MDIDLNGRTARIEGAMHPVATALGQRLADCGATLVADGLPDLLIVSAPLLPDPGFDWDGLAETASRSGAAMKARGAGRIVFLLSASATLPVRREPDFSMRMAGLHALVRTLAMSLAPEVAVNAMGAGAIGEDAARLVSGDAEMIGHAAVGRPGTVDEAVNVALFLSDPDNGYLTGQLLSADGGWAAGYGRNF